MTPLKLQPLVDNDVFNLCPAGVTLLRSAQPGMLVPCPDVHFTSPQHPIWHFYLGRDETGMLVAAAHTAHKDRITMYGGDFESVRFFLRAMFKNRT